ncbi:hypothetical protein B0T16DRAFT_425063 [Cercophora newfieldiana]|uniref:Ketoreductase domain-containing protein n=1 Tax=Cercophora newfieldiana TaxID=92897 RepID=A0AA39YQX0_9PEZI|nr:hypothetical protein B0T16DRAFT_425063 [Cercophora newfieldiana]
MASKVIIVTGASRGIGLAVTNYLLKQSHKVILVSRSTEQLQALKQQFPSHVEYLAADMTASDSAARATELAIKSFGRLDGVVINHGELSPITRLENASVDEWKALYDVNLFSALALVKETIPYLRTSNGSVVFVSSGAALKGYTAWGAYGGSKAALNSLAQHLAVEEPKIAAVAISPGRVDTDMQKELREKGNGAMSKSDYASFKTAFDEGKLNKPEWPGHVIARLALGAKPELSGKYFAWNSPELSDYQDGS